MEKAIENWLISLYEEIGIKNPKMNSIMSAIKNGISEIKEKGLFDKRFNVSRNISVLVYESGAVEIHVSIAGVVSTYECFEE